MFTMPEHFLGDLAACMGFGLAAIILVVVGFKLVDRLTPQCHFACEAQKGNVAAAILGSSLFLGMCYLVAHVITAIVQ